MLISVFFGIKPTVAYAPNAPAKPITIQERILETFGKDGQTMLKIMQCESGGRTNAVNKTSREHSIGLFQINTRVHPVTVEAMLDPEQNIAYAKTLYERRGVQPWSCAKLIR